MARRLALLAPVAALIYPAALWCGVAISPLFVIASLGVPVLGFVAAERAEGARARAIAHVVVAAPPLFSLLGGWLDFQHAVPFGSLSVWIVLWCVLAVVAAIPARGTQPIAVGASRRLAMAHGMSASIIAVFAIAHVVNHLGGVVGGDAHVSMMAAMRVVYRQPIVEWTLIAAVGFQVVSGAWLLRPRMGRSSGWLDTAQTASGAYMLMFFLSHVTAVLRARGRGVDTDWGWATSGGELLSDPWSVRLVPYYVVAIVALGLHVACGLRLQRAAVRAVAMAAVAVAAVVMVGALRA